MERDCRSIQAGQLSRGVKEVSSDTKAMPSSITEMNLITHANMRARAHTLKHILFGHSLEASPAASENETNLHQILEQIL